MLSEDANGLQVAQAEVVLFSHWEGKAKAGKLLWGKTFLLVGLL